MIFEPCAERARLEQHRRGPDYNVPSRAFERWLREVHDADPGSVFPSLSLLLDDSGRTSYDVVVDSALKATAHLPEPVVVDFGCGDGMLLALYGARNERAHLIGIDQSEKEIELARSTLEPFHAHLIAGDVRRTGLDDASADAVVSHMVLMLLDDASGALVEAGRILKSGGAFAAATGYLAPRLGVFEPIGEIVARARTAEGAPKLHADPRFGNIESMQTLPWEASGFNNPVITRLLFSRRLTIDQLWTFVAGWYTVATLSESGFRELEAAVREEAAMRAEGGMVEAQVALALIVSAKR